MLRALLMRLAGTDGHAAGRKPGDYTTRLALQEEAKTLPFGAVWDFYCESKACRSANNGWRK